MPFYKHLLYASSLSLLLLVLLFFYSLKFVLLIKSTNLHKHHHQVCSVLRILIDKSFREDNEPFSLKLHLIWCTVKECHTSGTDELLKR